MKQVLLKWSLRGQEGEVIGSEDLGRKNISVGRTEE